MQAPGVHSAQPPRSRHLCCGHLARQLLPVDLLALLWCQEVGVLVAAVAEGQAVQAERLAFPQLAAPAAGVQGGSSHTSSLEMPLEWDAKFHLERCASGGGIGTACLRGADTAIGRVDDGTDSARQALCMSLQPLPSPAPGLGEGVLLGVAAAAGEALREVFVALPPASAVKEQWTEQFTAWVPDVQDKCCSMRGW